MTTYFVYETSCYAVEADSEDAAKAAFLSPDDSGRACYLSSDIMEIVEADILPWTTEYETPAYIPMPDEIKS